MGGSEAEMLRRTASIVVIITTALIVSIFAGQARADVYPQSPSTYTGFGGAYTGSGIVATPNDGFVDVNHNSIVSGTPVDQTQHLTGGDTLKGVVTPGGQAIVVVIIHP
jgi:voltage-gated potassium channel Kch